MMTRISRWFYPSRPSVAASPNDYVMLWLIVAAGAALRFWQLGYAGLHGDEDIMALAARGLLEHGAPILPGDMVYVRALLHTYIIAGSMWLFGDSEWAMRLPSAVVGSLAPVLAYLMGRRFLEPGLSLGLAALIALLPIMIEISQTARMYVFFVAGLLAFGSLIFKWEATGKAAWLAASFAVWLVTIQFHPLAVFAAPLFLFPGLSARSWRRTFEGVTALASAFGAYLVSSAIMSSFYPGDSERLDTPPDASATTLELLMEGPFGWVAALGVVALLLVIWASAFGARQRALLPAGLLLSAGIVACVLLHYHVGGIVLLLGVVAWLRAGAAPIVRLLPAAAALAAMATVQIATLHGTGEFAGRQLIGALIGLPSVWPAIRFAVFSPAAVAVYLLVLAYAAAQLARGRRLPMHFLVFVLAVWAPLAAIGLFTWNAPPRYMLGILPFFLLCALAGIAYVVRDMQLGQRMAARPAAAAAFIVLTVVFINPGAMMVAASNDYRSHPDHKGAAQFIRSLPPGPGDLLIAEDSINQTYYLGRVDYRLINRDVARTHSILDAGTLLGQYTGTPVIGTGEELKAIVEQHGDGEIYIISSGESYFVEGANLTRGQGIYEFLKSDRIKVLWEGRDGNTRVWKVRR
jgi:4-amino-4-deoxy-L-arabinose transferase-like glycosyltransferase